MLVMPQGTVIIIANHGDRIDIPPGAVLENKIISGNLRILDHWEGSNQTKQDIVETRAGDARPDEAWYQETSG